MIASTKTHLAFLILLPVLLSSTLIFSVLETSATAAPCWKMGFDPGQPQAPCPACLGNACATTTWDLPYNFVSHCLQVRMELTSVLS